MEQEQTAPPAPVPPPAAPPSKHLIVQDGQITDGDQVYDFFDLDVVTLTTDGVVDLDLLEAVEGPARVVVFGPNKLTLLQKQTLLIEVARKVAGRPLVVQICADLREAGFASVDEIGPLCQVFRTVAKTGVFVVAPVVRQPRQSDAQVVEQAGKLASLSDVMVALETGGPAIDTILAKARPGLIILGA